MIIDEFELADLENDEKKLEATEQEHKTCEMCLNEFEYDEMDLYNGNWLCTECEEDMKKLEEEE